MEANIVFAHLVDTPTASGCFLGRNGTRAVKIVKEGVKKSEKHKDFIGVGVGQEKPMTQEKGDQFAMSRAASHC